MTISFKKYGSQLQGICISLVGLVVWPPIPYKDVNSCVWILAINLLIILVTNSWEILKYSQGQSSLNSFPRIMKNVQPTFGSTKDR